MIRAPELLEKLDIVEGFYQKETSNIPSQIFDMIDLQRELLLEAKKLYGDHISPLKFEDYEVPLSLTQSS
jgi:hypothetical protein